MKSLIRECKVTVSDNILDRAHRVGPLRNGQQAIICRFTSFRHRSLFYLARQILNNGVKVNLDLTNRRFKLLTIANDLIRERDDISFAYADINCRLKLCFSDGKRVSFNSQEELEKLLE